jgi:hypothetical protein
MENEAFLPRGQRHCHAFARFIALLGGARLMNYGDASSIVNSPIS